MTTPMTHPADDAVALLRGALDDAYVKCWTDVTMQRVRDTVSFLHPESTLTAPAVKEPEITLLLEAVDSGEQALIKLIWEVSNTSTSSGGPPAGAQIIQLDEFLKSGTWKRTGVRGGKLPDFVIAHRDPHDQHPDVYERRMILDVVVEVKGGAYVNGDAGYCYYDKTRMKWSNQAICYVHGCWANLEDPANALDFRAARFVWIGPDKYVKSPDGPWGTKALQEHERGQWRDEVDTAIDLQRKAARAWSGLSLSRVESTLRDLGGGNAVIADVIGSWRAYYGI